MAASPLGGQGSQKLAWQQALKEAKGAKEMSWRHTLEEAKGAKVP